MNILLASKNPVKIATVQGALERIFPDEAICVEGVSAASGVADQPMTDDETLLGAQNRARNACHKGEAEYYVGLEGGVMNRGGRLSVFGWVCISDGENEGIARTSEIMLPSRVCALVNEGYELAEADNIVFGTTESGKKTGAVGLLTGGLVTRQDIFEQAVIEAMVPFMNKDLYQ